MITFEIIQKVWQMLGEPDDYDKIAAHELDMVTTPSGHPLITIDTNNHRHLLIPTADEIQIIEDRQSAGVHIVSNKWGYEDHIHTYIDVICLKTHLNGIFDLMVLDMLTALPEDYEHPDRVCRRVLNRWREFLTPEPTHVPEKSKIVGLWGELWILGQLSLRHSDIIRTWTGPDGGRFDFFNNDTGLEVKSTLKRKGTTVTINGHDQLEPPNSGSLFFTVLKLEENPVGGTSVPDLVDQLVENGIGRSQILTSLLKIGISPDVLPYTADQRFDLREWLLYEVTDDFPRIVASSFKGDHLPNGVIALTYQIDLSSEPPFSLNDEAKAQFLKKFADIM